MNWHKVPALCPLRDFCIHQLHRYYHVSLGDCLECIDYCRITVSWYCCCCGKRIVNRIVTALWLGDTHKYRRMTIAYKQWMWAVQGELRLPGHSLLQGANHTHHRLWLRLYPHLRSIKVSGGQPFATVGFPLRVTLPLWRYLVFVGVLRQYNAVPLLSCIATKYTITGAKLINEPGCYTGRFQLVASMYQHCLRVDVVVPVFLTDNWGYWVSINYQDIGY